VTVHAAAARPPAHCARGGHYRHQYAPARNPPLPPQLAAAYADMLSAFEDFLQKRSFAKLVALARAKAALPIAPYGDEIAAAVRDHPVVVLAGDTGCGKSTQLPQFLLRAGFGRVAVTQPRRLAATALAARVAHETLHAHGARVGHRVRFDAAASAASAVVFCTEGVLLRCGAPSHRAPTGMAAAS
jgi:HrpA-like RNA helicase